MHSLNMALRFMLEVFALVAFAIWGWNAASGWVSALLAICLPVFFAAMWAIFAVEGDPSRSGKTVIPTKGIIRLLLELLFFGLAVWALFDLGYIKSGFAFSFLVVLHYALSYDRILWLIKH